MIPSQASRWLRFTTLFALVLPAAAKEHAPLAIEPATRFAAVENHSGEAVAIAAEPYESKEKCAIFRVDYLRHGILPVRLIITNNSDDPLALKAMRILFEPAGSDAVQATDPEQTEDRFSIPKSRLSQRGRTVLSSASRRRSTAHDRQIEQDFRDFEFSAQSIAPHTTRAGFIFYVVGNPITSLHGAHLSVQKLLTKNTENLSTFDIPFDLYLRSKSGRMN